VRNVQIDELTTPRVTEPDGDVSAGSSRRSPARAPSKVNILIVDDKPQNLDALAQMLSDLDENIVRASSGRAALRFLLRQEAAIVLLDVEMPDMDGYELVTLIRTRERTQHTPVIFITAYDRDEAEITRGYALGAVDYVFKPINPTVLKAKITVFVDLYKKTEAVRAQAEHERQLELENLRVRAEKMEAERALREIEERQAAILRSLPIAVYTADLKGRFSGPRFLSESMAAVVGYSPQAFVDDDTLWTERIHPADLPGVLSKVAAMADVETLSIEYRWRCADGTERIFMDQGRLLRDGQGEPREIIGTCTDVTYRRQLEQQLFQSQKMEAMGQLTGGIAHDFNNMLSVIIWNVDLITRSLKTGSKDYDRAQNALGAALNGAELIRQLLTFARQQPQQAQVIDLSELVPHMARLLTPVVGEEIAFDVRVTKDTWPIRADRAQMESALLNLALNARDAMPDGGSLAIEVANTELTRTELEAPPGQYVRLAVIDTGTGMPQEVIDRAFEPFYTTKGQGKGTGLGLSMVYGFVKQSNGHVRIESAVGLGTTICLYLPRADVTSAKDEQTTATIALEPNDDLCVVLVVEDNASVRSMTIARLEELGHDVIEADGASTALAILDDGRAVDVLFTDVVMPGGMSGLDLAFRARELRPDIGVILASGYPASFHASEGFVGEMLQKPYRDEDLATAIKRARSR
jgi:PAS domain S-box-containing protein